MPGLKRTIETILQVLIFKFLSLIVHRTSCISSSLPQFQSYACHVNEAWNRQSSIWLPYGEFSEGLIMNSKYTLAERWRATQVFWKTKNSMHWVIYDYPDTPSHISVLILLVPTCTETFQLRDSWLRRSWVAPEIEILALFGPLSWEILNCLHLESYY